MHLFGMNPSELTGVVFFIAFIIVGCPLLAAWMSKRAMEPGGFAYDPYRDRYDDED